MRMIQTHADTAWSRLHQFLTCEMQMNHVYQPVMLRTLLLSGGMASTHNIAEAFVAVLACDESHTDHYEDRAKNMVGRVLRNHGLVVYNRKTDGFELALP